MLLRTTLTCRMKTIRINKEQGRNDILPVFFAIKNSCRIAGVKLYFFRLQNFWAGNDFFFEISK
jgi:hypothetical protein